jgi:hypothetical protein
MFVFVNVPADYREPKPNETVEEVLKDLNDLFPGEDFYPG